MALISDIKSKILFKSRIKEYNKSRLTSQSSLFCYAPSNALRFSLNGNAFVCCFNRMFSLGKYPEKSISEIWFGNQRRELQKSVKRLKLYEIGCHSCYSSLMSRSYNLVGARNYDLGGTSESLTYPQVIDFELDNLCNLKCVMCNGENSSSIRTQIECEKNYPMYYDGLFVKQLDEFIPYLKEARFSGGEPFLSKVYYDIWNRILDLNPKCKIYIQSNGTVFNNRIIDLFARGDVNISLSIDSIDAFTYINIRRGAIFEKVMKNFNEFWKLSQTYDREIGVSFCLMKQNINEFIEYLEYFNRYNVKITIHKVVFPVQFGIVTLTLIQLEEILKRFNSYKPVLQTEVEKINYNVFKSIVSFLEATIVYKKEFEKVENATLNLNLKDFIWLKIENRLLELKLENQYEIAKDNYKMLLKKISCSEHNDEYLILLNEVPISLLLPELITNEPERLFSRIFIESK